MEMFYGVDVDEYLELFADMLDEYDYEMELSEFVTSSPYAYHYCPDCS